MDAETTASVDIDIVFKRLVALEDENAIRRVMTRYMELCDVPLPDHAGLAMNDLFAEDAIWEGIGSQYAKKFGRITGRQQIVEFVQSYLPPSAHFRTNVHFLTSEHITVMKQHGRGQWLMQQISEYEDGRTELINARLAVDFRRVGGNWQIAHFRTERLLARPLRKAATGASK